MNASFLVPPVTCTHPSAKPRLFKDRATGTTIGVSVCNTCAQHFLEGEHAVAP